MNGRSKIIEVHDLMIGYGGHIVMQNLNFDIFAGEIVCLMGGSGCGKSTLLKHITGLYEPMKGDILIYGESIVKASGEKKNSIMRKFGVAYQGGALFGSMSVAENVELPLREYTDLTFAERMKAVNAKLDMVGLHGAGELMPGELSGGMRKRAGLARALVLEPELLFFDEPSAGLDPLSSAELDRLILDLREKLGATVVVVTHELDSVFAIADRVIMLDKNTKTMVADGSPVDLRIHCKNEWVRKFLTRGGLCRSEKEVGYE